MYQSFYEIKYDNNHKYAMIYILMDYLNLKLALHTNEFYQVL